jgi:hypothetical protein
MVACQARSSYTLPLPRQTKRTRQTGGAETHPRQSIGQGFNQKSALTLMLALTLALAPALTYLSNRISCPTSFLP